MVWYSLAIGPDPQHLSSAFDRWRVFKFKLFQPKMYPTYDLSFSFYFGVIFAAGIQF